VGSLIFPRAVVRIERGHDTLKLHLACGHTRCWPFDVKFGAAVGDERTCLECARAKPKLAVVR